MKYRNFKREVVFEFSPAIGLERVFPSKTRRAVRVVLNILLGISAVLGAAAFFSVPGAFSLGGVSLHLPENLQEILKELFIREDQIIGAFLILLSLRVLVGVLSAFFNHHYLGGIESVKKEYSSEQKQDRINPSFEVAEVCYEADSADVSIDLLLSRWGSFVLLRCGIKREEISDFARQREQSLSADKVEAKFKGEVGLADLCRAVYESDEELQYFLEQKEIQRSEFVRAARWVEMEQNEYKEEKRWWSRDKLTSGAGIGKNWSYGKTFVLREYGYNIAESDLYSSMELDSSVMREELGELERALSEGGEGNAVLIGRARVQRLEIAAQLAREIEAGTAPPVLKEKRVFVINTSALLSGRESKAEFEDALISVLEQAEEAGNIILVLNNFAALIEGGEEIGSKPADILKQYLPSVHLKVVAVTDPESFHRIIEPDNRLMTKLEPIFIEVEKRDTILRVLQEKALSLEARGGVVFTYPALELIAESAKRHFAGEVVIDKALDLEREAASLARDAGEYFITKEKVADLVKTKTGVPVGGVGRERSEELLKLEDELHKYVVAQDKAISSVARAMRRVGAGIRDADRPIGTFLFLGPTGVGKTSTAKALSKSFFGSEQDMVRLDMAEYTGGNALSRLIGSENYSAPGTLTSMIRENRYGVLLLDEFEKTTEEVHNLFLRILDEGVFSDHRGKEVNARDLIIIATSNAGSDYIWQLFNEGIEVSESKEQLVDNIIERGIFRPELLNRFDGVIVFHPLQEQHLREIAKMMLEDLNSRLKRNKGVEVEMTDELVSFLVEKGYEPEFGARPMQRVVKKRVEQAVADKLLRGELEAGMTARLTLDDLS